MPLDKKQAAQLKRLGANVRRQRNKRLLSQSELAKMVRLNHRTIQKIEAGDVNILVTTIGRIRKALGCSWDDLLGDF
jgi:transcriptional regulator with XRE-family HTH domain